MTPKQQRFVDEYLIDLNATQAAIRAGYAVNYANTNAPKLLQNTAIKAAIEDRQKARSERTGITQDMVLKELAKIGFSDMRKLAKWGPALGETIIDDNIVQTNGVQLIDSEDIDDDSAGAISEIRQTTQGVAIKLHDKQAALINIGKHLGMWKNGPEDNTQLTIKIEGGLDASIEPSTDVTIYTPEGL